MHYDFDAPIDRRGTGSIKHDFLLEKGMPADILPMWVADMDFAAPPEVLDELQQAVSRGVFGYTKPKCSYYNAVLDWFGSRYGYRAEADDIVQTPGVVCALAESVRAFTDPGAAVMVQPPVYYPFYDVILRNNRKLVTNPLLYSNGRYSIDFQDFERKATEQDVRMFILCSPHNPVGRVWTRSELERLGEVCQRLGVLVVADEIHCDFAWPNHPHTCFGLLDDEAVIATAPSKTFNLAGLQVANVFVKNSGLRSKLCAEAGRNGLGQPNLLGLLACQSSYSKGGQWLDALRSYLLDNIALLRQFLTERLPRIKLVEPEGTYLAWLDFTDFGLSQASIDRRLRDGAKLWLNSGTMFGPEGQGFQRINIACSRSVLREALTRLEKEFAG
ncbi:MAG: pyridoxal phosphate-dependent aminotransferase [Actinomycetia bacterium]|nr:pyridoxal phosphate-dependent aminotransferase [Actinomycetes bacterium]